MKYLEVATMPTSITRKEMQALLATSCRGAHESIMRSYQILARVKDLLQKKVDSEVILDLIDVMESKPSEAPEREE